MEKACDGADADRLLGSARVLPESVGDVHAARPPSLGPAPLSECPGVDAPSACSGPHIQRHQSQAKSPSPWFRSPLFDRVSHGVYRVHQGNSGQSPSPGPADTSPTPFASLRRHREAAREPLNRGVSPTADVILVGCLKSKRTAAAAAKDLYTSALFTKERAHSERSGLPWYILSAKYGLVGHDEWIEPYERHLPEMAPSFRQAWGGRVIEQLGKRERPLQGKVIEIHAGPPTSGHSGRD